ncbi:hypothetical protein A6770_30990 [Nostoc minutum NIES-26]|uniref:SF3 helicase domain-containing protein n=1 Tax=Nostoc minutum NIES-26 TaxID=1844469 RepID=A0A367QAA2_9NOSO|nr:hypothetical protein A6770_30990 [Nostoc minutum NIES-26]
MTTTLIQSVSPEQDLRSNRFESFEQFQQFIRTSFTLDSGIAPEMFEACVRFHRDLEFSDGGDVEAPIHEALGWDFTRFGKQASEPLYAAFLLNEDGTLWQAIVSLWDDERQRPYRYLAPKSNGDRVFLPPIPTEIRKRIGARYGVQVPLSGSFWEWFANAPEALKIPRIPTEGAKKGLCGLSQGYVPLVFYGCTCGAKTKDAADNKIFPTLISDLEPFAIAQTIWLFAFDQDSKPKAKAAVAIGKRKLRTALIDAECIVGDILWKAEQGKGWDDLVVNNGSGAFDSAYSSAISQLERQFQKHQSNDNKKSKLPPRRAAQQLLERYREAWKYDLEQQTWRCWHKVWGPVPDEVFTQAVYRDLEILPNVDYDNFAYLENVVKFLKIELLEKQWHSFNRMEWIAFNDCVYEVATGKTHDHAPGFGFTSCLEHNFPKHTVIDPNSTLLEQLRVNTPTFYSWAMHAQQGDPLKVLKLLSIINGVVKFRFYDLQMFVHLCGVPGAGKGTYARLLESIVGKQNHTSAKLHKLADDNVIAAVINSQLVICPDEKKQAVDYSGLLSLTGGDNIPYRQIYKPQANGKFLGTVVVISNAPIFVGDVLGIDRRLCLVTFDVPLDVRDTNIEKKMQLEVPALTAFALSMPDEQVSDMIRGTGEAAIPDFKRQQWLHKTENDSVALFMEERLVKASPESYVVVGNKNSDAYTLYGAYAQLCEENNSKSLFTANNFRNHLLELCRELGWKNVREARQRDNQYRIYGVRLRDKEDTALRISEVLGSPPLPEPEPADLPEALAAVESANTPPQPLISTTNLPECVTVCKDCVEGVYSPKPLSNIGCVECVDSKLHSSPEAIDSDFKSVNSDPIKFDRPPQSATHSHTHCTDCVSTPTPQSTQPHTTAHTELIIGVGRYADYYGERVEIVGWEDRGTKVQIEFKSGKCQLVKRGSLKVWNSDKSSE